MQVRGAPLIGATAAYGMALAMRARCERRRARRRLPRCSLATRPTAVNLRWALDGHAADGCAACRQGARGARLRARRRDRRGGRGRRAAPSPAHGLPLIEAAFAEEGARARRDPDPLQCRLARRGRLGDGAGAGLSRARPRHSRPCLGRRDAAAQPGRQPHRLGTRPARRAAHRDRRQCRRASDAARPGRSLPRRLRPHHRRRATSPTRSGPI